MTRSRKFKKPLKLSQCQKLQSNSTRRRLTRSKRPYQSTMSSMFRHRWSTTLSQILSESNLSHLTTISQMFNPPTHLVASFRPEEGTMSSSKMRSNKIYSRFRVKKKASKSRKDEQLKKLKRSSNLSILLEKCKKLDRRQRQV